MSKKGGRQTASVSYVPPFTEMPAELQTGRRSFGRFLQGALNAIVLIALAVVLLGLVAAFAYTWFTQPEKVVTFINDLVSGLRSLLP